MDSLRQRFINRAVILINDSGNADLTLSRLASICEEVCAFSPDYRSYYFGMEDGTIKATRFFGDLRRACLRHPAYKQMVTAAASRRDDPKVVYQARVVARNIERRWRASTGYSTGPVQQLGQSRMADFLAEQYSILQSALRTYDDEEHYDG